MTPKTLKSKVSLVYFSLIFIILMLGVISLWNLTRIGRAVNNIVITNYNSIQRLGHMSDALNSQSSILLTYWTRAITTPPWSSSTPRPQSFGKTTTWSMPPSLSPMRWS